MKYKNHQYGDYRQLKKKANRILASQKRDDLFILSFENAYKENFEKLYKYAMTITLSEDIAKDVVSEVFFNLWNMKTGFAEIKELDSYLFIATKNQAIRVISQDPKNFVSVDFENSLRTIETINPENLMLTDELFVLIEEIVASLPDQCQLVFNMVKGKQMKHKEVSDELGITIGTVKNHIIKALSKIREGLTDYYNASDDKSFNIYTRISSFCVVLLNSFLVTQ